MRCLVETVIGFDSATVFTVHEDWVIDAVPARNLPARISRARDGGASRRRQSGFHCALDGDASLGLCCPLAGSLKVSVMRVFRSMAAPAPQCFARCRRHRLGFHSRASESILLLFRCRYAFCTLVKRSCLVAASLLSNLPTQIHLD